MFGNLWRSLCVIFLFVVTLGRGVWFVAAATINPTSFSTDESSGLVLDFSTSTVSGTLASGNVTFSLDLDGDGTYDDGSTTGGVFVIDRATLTANGINNDASYTGGLQIVDLDGTTTGDITITVNNVPPTVTITSPVTGAVLTGTSTTVNWTTTEPHDGLQYTVEYNTGGGYVFVTSGNTTSGTDSASWNLGNLQDASVELRVSINDGTTTVTDSVTSLTVDTQAPVITSFSVPTINEGDDATISVSATDFTGVNYQLIFDGGSFATSSGSFDLTWAQLSGAGVDNDGSFSFTGVATDAYGQSSTTGLTLTVTNVAPSVGVTNPTAGAQLSGSTTVQWTGSDPADIVEYTIEYTTGGSFIFVTSGTNVSGANSYAWTSTGIDSTTVQVRVTLADDDTTTASVSDQFTLDNTVPSVSIVAPAIDEGTNASIDLSGSTDTGVGLASGSYEVILSGTSFTTHTNGVFSLSWANLATAGITNDGTYDFTGVVTDDIGNIGTQTGTLTINNVLPTVIITNPGTGDMYSGSIDVQWTTTEPVDTLDWSLSYSLDGINYVFVTSGTTTSGADNYVRDSSAINGTAVSLEIEVDDGGASIVVFETASFVIDNIAPTVVVVADPIGEGTTATIDLSGSTDTGSGLGSGTYEVILSGTSFTTHTNGVFSLSWTDLATAGITNDGTYDFTGVVTDGVSNIGTQTGSLVINNIAPTVSVSAPVTGNELSGSTNVQWMTTEPVDNPLSWVLYYSTDGTNYTQITTGTTNSGSDSYAWDSSAVNSTGVTVQLVVSDDDTSVTGSSATFTVDNTGPAIDLQVPDINEGAGVTISMTGTSDAHVGMSGATYNLIISGSNFSNTSGVFVFTWSDLNTIGIVNDGTFGVTGIVTDRIGNASSTGTNLVIANVAPVVSISSPSSGDQYSGSVTVSWSMTDVVDTPLSYTGEYSTNGGTSWNTLTGGTSYGSLSYVRDTSAFDTASMQVRLSVMDDDETTVVTSDSFTVDNTAPVIVFNSTRTHIGNLMPVNFSLSTDNIVGIASYKIDVLNYGSTVDYSSTNATGNLAFVVPNPGTYSVTVTVTDKVGNVATATKSINYFDSGAGGGSPRSSGGGGGYVAPTSTQTPLIIPAGNASRSQLDDYITDRFTALTSDEDNGYAALDRDIQIKYVPTINKAMQAFAAMELEARYSRVSEIVAKIQKFDLDKLNPRLANFLMYLENVLILTLEDEHFQD